MSTHSLTHSCGCCSFCTAFSFILFFASSFHLLEISENCSTHKLSVTSQWIYSNLNTFIILRADVKFGICLSVYVWLCTFYAWKFISRNFNLWTVFAKRDAVWNNRKPAFKNRHCWLYKQAAMSNWEKKELTNDTAIAAARAIWAAHIRKKRSKSFNHTHTHKFKFQKSQGKNKVPVKQIKQEKKKKRETAANSM